MNALLLFVNALALVGGGLLLGWAALRLAGLVWVLTRSEYEYSVLVRRGFNGPRAFLGTGGVLLGAGVCWLWVGCAWYSGLLLGVR